MAIICQQLGVVCQPITPFHIIASVMTVTLILVTLICLVDGTWQAIAQTYMRYFAIMILSIVGSIFIAIATWNPIQQTHPTTQEYHLSVVLDVSDSILRRGDWSIIQQNVSEFVRVGVQNLPDDISLTSPASILTFGDGVRLRWTTLGEIGGHILQLTESQFAGRGATNIGQALEHAADTISRSGNRGEILLITDGHETVSGALDAALNISRQGIVITVLPLSAGSPQLGITGLDLSPQTHALQFTTLRGVIENQTFEDVVASFEIWQNPALVAENSLFGVMLQAQAQSPISPQSYGMFRQNLLFEGVGIQFVDVLLNHPNDDSIVQHRRLFTHVVRPIEILAYGDSNWRGGISPDVANVTPEQDPRTLETIDLGLYDAVVISGLPASLFSTSALERLASAVEDNGLGLLLINGDHRGVDEQAETVLRSYKPTPLDRVLPIETDPRPFTPEPPPRHVVILMDASGSMGGWRMAKAKEIANYIIAELLRPEDILDVVVFSTGARHLVERLPATPSNKQFAIDSINRISAGGGTDPREALRLLGTQQLQNCGLIFISDGEFASGIAARPDCRATAFGIDTFNIGPISEIADPFIVNQNFNPVGIEIPYFEIEERDKFFELGAYTPLALAVLGGDRERLYVPNLRLDGTAITYIRDGATLITSRPRLLDPVLVYGEAGLGTVGVLTTRIPDSWTTIPDGRQAIEEWVVRTVGYYDRDRYIFNITDDGHILRLIMQVRNQSDTVPQVGALDVSFVVNDLVTPARVEPLGAATFLITGSPTRSDHAQVASLVVRESGIEALPRPQHIPILIPANSQVRDVWQQEDTSIGTNELLLHQITEISGGVYAPDVGYTFFRGSSTISDIEHWWRYAIIIGAVLYISAIALQRLLR